MATVESPGSTPIRLFVPQQVGDAEAPLSFSTLFGESALLKGVGAAVLTHIGPRIEISDLSDGTIVFAEGDAGDSLYLIAKGSVKISKRGRGGQQETLTFLQPNDYFGEMALVDRAPRSAQAAAVGPTTLGRIDRVTWDLLLHFAPNEVMGNFTRSVTQRLRQNNDHFIEQMMRSERLSLLGTTISSIVHDMNNPITTILGACQVIQSSAADELTTQMSGLIKEAIDRMETMTREMLDFSRGDTQLKLKLVNVPELVRQLEPDLNKCRAASKVEVDVPFTGAIRIDRHRMLRVFGNLIKNAREAMKAGDDNLLRISARQVDDSVRFEVTDTGHGIKSDVLPKIFEPFMTHGKSNGTGLGLAISKAVVDAHGGKISVTSSEAGTTFAVDLPLPQKES
jgi:signal transduction histidine kinase